VKLEFPNDEKVRRLSTQMIIAITIEVSHFNY